MVNYCMHCMEKLSGSPAFCPYCGHPSSFEVPAYHLLPGTILNGKYLVGKSIGEGGFGITYIGRDLNLDIKVAVKEYYPLGYSSRYNTASNNVISSTDNNKKDFYEKGKKAFIEEARMLAKFADCPGIVSARDYFETNHTAYLVMNYLEGKTLKEIIKESGPIPPQSAIDLFLPVMNALEALHNSGMIHRDVSPDNIIVTNNTVKLLDFGAARYFSLESDLSMSVILKAGYTPEEQYRRKGSQGPWTDIYSLCATMYKCITGITPPEALDRMSSDELLCPSASGIAIPPHIEAAIMKGLSFKAENRQQSVSELIRELTVINDDSPVTIPLNAENRFNQASQPQLQPQPQPQVQEKDFHTAAIAAICISVFIILIIVIAVVTPGQTSNSASYSTSESSDNGYGKVNLRTEQGSGNMLNLRSGPGYDYDIVGTIGNGEMVELIREENGWMYISYDGLDGWVNIDVAGFNR